MLQKWIETALRGQEKTGEVLIVRDHPGSGKTTFANKLAKAVGEKNVARNSRIEFPFNGWLVGKQLVILEEELLPKDWLDRVKPWVTNPSVLIELKGEDPFYIKNKLNFLVLTSRPYYINVGEARRFISCNVSEAEDALKAIGM